jgi:hypothetical protein
VGKSFYCTIQAQTGKNTSRVCVGKSFYCTIQAQTGKNTISFASVADSHDLFKGSI